MVQDRLRALALSSSEKDTLENEIVNSAIDTFATMKSRKSKCSSIHRLWNVDIFFTNICPLVPKIFGKLNKPHIVIKAFRVPKLRSSNEVVRYIYYF